MTSAVLLIANQCRMRLAAIGVAFVHALVLTGCASSDPKANAEQSTGLGETIGTLGGWLSPYRPDVLQGNVITKEQAAQLRVGLSREQVAGLLGTPLLQSVFHSNRWDYVFTWASQGAPDQQRRLTVWFEDNKLVKFVGDDMPSEQAFVESISRPIDTSEALPLSATPEQIKQFQAQQAALKDNNAGPVANNANAPSTTNFPALNAQGAAQ